MDIRHESQKIEYLLSVDHSKEHSAFHSELRRIMDADSKNGVLNIDQYRKDLSAIEQQLQKDGFLPQFKLLLNENEAHPTDLSQIWKVPSHAKREDDSVHAETRARVKNENEAHPSDLSQIWKVPSHAKREDDSVHAGTPARVKNEYETHPSDLSQIWKVPSNSKREDDSVLAETRARASQARLDNNQGRSEVLTDSGNHSTISDVQNEVNRDTRSRMEPTGGKLYEMHKLPHRSGDHPSPDAMVLLPKNFDPNKPIHLVVYDHGWYDSAKSSYEHAHLAEQMAKAPPPPNTVLIVPEWQRTPGSSGKEGGNMGASGNENFMSGMVQDIFNRTPELKGKTLADVDHIGIVSHSAGYHAAESQLYRNGEFSKKIDSVTLLDSLYDGTGFDKWIKDNINDLSNGKKHFHNIFNTSTAENSRAQAERVQAMLREAKLSPDSLSTDFERSKPVNSRQLNRYAFVFKATSTAHMEIPQKCTAVVQAAANGDETV